MTPSRPPKFEMAVRRTASTWPCWVTSATLASTSENPFFLNESRASANGPSVLAQMTTFAPASRHASAQARPMPMLPPVTTIRFPDRSDFLCINPSLSSSSTDCQNLESQLLKVPVLSTQHALGIEQKWLRHLRFNPTVVQC